MESGWLFIRNEGKTPKLLFLVEWPLYNSSSQKLLKSSDASFKDDNGGLFVAINLQVTFPTFKISDCQCANDFVCSNMSCFLIFCSFCNWDHGPIILRLWASGITVLHAFHYFTSSFLTNNTQVWLLFLIKSCLKRNQDVRSCQGEDSQCHSLYAKTSQYQKYLYLEAI